MSVFLPGGLGDQLARENRARRQWLLDQMTKTTTVHLCDRCWALLRGGLELEELTVGCLAARACDMCGGDLPRYANGCPRSHAIYRHAFDRLRAPRAPG